MKMSIHIIHLFHVIFCKNIFKSNQIYIVNNSSSDYYQCESIEDIPENETRSCQVRISIF